MRVDSIRATLASALLVFVALPIPAHDEGRVSTTLESGREVVVFPIGHLFAPYTADMHAPHSTISVRSATTTGIAETSDFRYYLALGGRFGFVRWQPKKEGGRSWQLSLDVGFDAMFDVEKELDNIGWDGNYGVSLSTARGPLAWRLAYLHTSSHVGDEYAERTGRKRIGYTRSEWIAAIGWRFLPKWRTYAEVGYANNPKESALQEPLRVQTGLEFQAPDRFWGGRMGWYWALDVSAMEELDWSPDVAMQLGWMLPSGGRTWRLGLEYYDGRVPIGEFYRDSEAYISFGLAAEL